MVVLDAWLLEVDRDEEAEKNMKISKETSITREQALSSNLRTPGTVMQQNQQEINCHLDCLTKAAIRCPRKF